MGITSSSARRRKTAAAAVAVAALGLTAVAGTSAYAAATADGTAGTTATTSVGTVVSVGTTADRSAEVPAAGVPAAPGAAADRSARGVPAAGSVPEGISRLAQGTGRNVAITIDDGPDPRWTPQVLQVLRENHVKATFCMIGTNALKYPELVREVAAEGHLLCDHTVDHDETMDHKPVAYQRQQILDGQAMIERAAPGVPVSYYRAPGGAFTPDSRAIAAASGMRPLGWSVDPRDWSRPGLASIIGTVEGELPARPTVLFHDGGGDRTQTVAALKEYLPWLTSQGYTFTFPDRTTP
ncbi:polysaccharide deacetylase family protein [Streptomyces sp. NPDC097619]|uniref:polysaccharide deacetylase family protein n=1 Tax=Streptomyces sp. NPDC097619 TaxID=3157228 RepID=UPI00331A489F